jgi:hypothetical protein
MARYSRKIIRQYFRRSDDPKASRPEKGKALEDLTCYVFGKIPGVSVSQRNVLNTFDSEELDVAFWNEQHALGLRSFNAIILVECKNWSTPVGSSEVTAFVAKIEHRALDFGILVAANGITGNAADRRQAHDIASKALMKGVRLVIITRKEIEGMQNSNELVASLKEKVCQLVVSGTVWP